MKSGKRFAGSKCSEKSQVCQAASTNRVRGTVPQYPTGERRPIFDTNGKGVTHQKMRNPWVKNKLLSQETTPTQEERNEGHGKHDGAKNQIADRVSVRWEI